MSCIFSIFATHYECVCSHANASLVYVNRLEHSKYHREMEKIMRMIMVLMTILMTAGMSSCSNDDDELPHAVKNSYVFDGEVVKIDHVKLDRMEYEDDNVLLYVYDENDELLVTVSLDQRVFMGKVIDMTAYNLFDIYNKGVHLPYVEATNPSDIDQVLDINILNRPTEGTLFVSEIKPYEEYEVKFDFEIEGKKLSFNYTGHVEQEKAAYISVGNLYEPIEGVLIDAEALKKQELVRIMVVTQSGFWAIEESSHNLGSVVDLSQYDYYQENPFKIMASESYGLKGKEYLYGGKTDGVYAIKSSLASDHYMRIKKCSNDEYLISISYKRADSEIPYIIEYVGEVQSVNTKD